MSIWNKVLVGLVIVAGLAFAYLSMRTLKTHQYWRELTIKLEEKTEKVAKENELLANGAAEDAAEPVKGVKQYREEINTLVALRGRVWTNCTPGNVDPQTGQVSVTVEQLVKDAIPVGRVLYAFDENEIAQSKDNQYVGQFTVTAVTDTSVVLAPVMRMNERELARMAKSKGPWVLYEKMPSDNHRVFASLSEEEKKKLLPEEVVDEFIYDGEAATWEKIDEWKLSGDLVDEYGNPLRDKNTGEKIADAKGTYQRPLRDYSLIFANGNLERKVMAYIFDMIKEETSDLERAAKEAKEQIASRENQKTILKGDLAKLSRERDALAAHHAALQKKVAELGAQVTKMLEDNKAIAAQIAKAQLDAAKRIDARVPAVANSVEGGK